MKTLRDWICAGGLLTVLLTAVTIHAPAADDMAKPPDRRELWVPVADLKTVLDQNPRAVMLSREQYEALLRDAKKNLTRPPGPSQRATLASARYMGELSGDVVDVQAEFTVNVLSDEWAEVPLRLGALSMGNIKVDGDAVVAGSGEGARLIIRGRGERKITAEFMLPVRRDSGVNSLQLSLPKSAAGLFTINLPPDTQVESSAPVDVQKTPGATAVNLALTAQNDSVLTWRGTGNSQQGAAMLFQESSYIYSIDETRIQADLGIVLNAALGSLPASVQIKIPPGATPLQVVGGEVLKWTADGGVLTVNFTPGDRTTTGLRVLLETPSLNGEIKGSLALPLPEVVGVRRAAGKFAVIGSKGVKTKEIMAGREAMQGEGLFDNTIEQDERFTAAYGFAVQPASIKAVIEKIKPQYSVDLDTLAEFKREAISMERTLSVNGEEGEIFETGFVMPEGEELLSVRNEDGSEPDWKADGANVKIRWSDGVSTGQHRIFKIKSRIEPQKWPETDLVTLGDLKIPGAEKINGYVALKADAMFRLETSIARGLEQRDGRTTPVQGDFAWFRRDSFQLQVKVARREAEVQCTLLGYALPVDGALDVNGSLDFNILYSGIRKLRVKVPAESTEQFYFDGAQIAERNREGDTWTIVLQKETSGNYSLKFHAVIPFDESHSDFHVDIPGVEPLDARQQAGTWAIEANTATEISFKAAGMNELDPLHAPVLADYQPRHHVIGVFGYLGSQHSLKLEGVKHEAAPILTAVADNLELDTVVSTSGAERHQAVFYIRTAGDQFLDVTLPEDSSIWSLTVDGDAMKPVAERPNVVRVQLAATLDRTRAAKIRLLYETRRHEWGASGGYRLIAPRLDGRIPVLRSEWHVWLPDGFSYTSLDSNLRTDKTPQAMPLLFIPWQWARTITLPPAVPVSAGLPSSNAAVSPEFYAGVEEVKKMFAEADSFYQTGRYNLAYKRCEQILNIDPYNIAARKMEEKINLAKDHYEDQAYNTTRGTMAWQLDHGWDRPVRKYQGHDVVRIETGPTNVRNTEYIQNKLNHIIIPKIEFRDATVREAIDFLRQKTRELDTQEPDSSRRGVNIVLKSGGPATPNETAPTIAPGDARITLSLTNIPLGEALRYITNLAGMKVKIDPYGVTLVPLSEPTDTLITKEYIVPPHFLISGSLGATAGDSGANGPVLVMRQDAKSILANAGIEFPPGASANYVASSGKLIVRNTEANLDLMDNFVQPLLAADGSVNDSNGQADNAGLAYQAKKASGLLPMKLDLERAGREFTFEGLYAAESVRFHYVNWWDQARRGWIWWVAGGLAFFAIGQPGAWRRLAWAVLVLTFFPLCIAQSLTGMCNALLAGWLTGFVIYQIATRFVFRVRVVEAKAV